MAVLAQDQPKAVIQRQLHGAERGSDIFQRADRDWRRPGQFAGHPLDLRRHQRVAADAAAKLKGVRKVLLAEADELSE
ncbi:MAG: hypothetical protein E5V78_32300, partial [Mesorhizobium sp.]